MRAPMVLSAVACILMIAGGARAPLPASMEAPMWSVGDFWEYRFNSTFQDTVFLNGTVRAEISEAANRTVRSIPQDVFVVPTVGSGRLEASLRRSQFRAPGTSPVSSSSRSRRGRS